MQASEAIAKLRANPKSFLRQNCVIIAGGTTRNPGMTIFRMIPGNTDVRSRGSILKSRMKSRPFWSVNISNNNGGNPAGATLADDEFAGYYIPMKQMTDHADNVFGQAPNDGSADILLTSQLTGCTFGFASLNGHFFAGHIQPEGGVARDVTERNMRNKLQSGFSGGGRTIEKGRDYKDIATIVGVFSGGKWEIYMQRIDWNPGDGSNGFKEIAGISRLG